MKVEFTGNIICIRAVEDCIRATAKYTEGLGTMRKMHPVQGEDFPSKNFCKYYEVYPHVDLDKKLPVGEAINVAMDWLWRDTPCIDVVFRYDYRANTASVAIKDGPEAVKELVKTIPGLSESLAKAVLSTSNLREVVVPGKVIRIHRHSDIPHLVETRAAGEKSGTEH